MGELTVTVTIRSNLAATDMDITAEGMPKGNSFGVGIQDLFSPSGWIGGDYPRDEVFAAIESEFGVRIVPADAIVIEHSELPPVEVNEKRLSAGVEGGPYAYVGLPAWYTPEGYRNLGVAWLALSEYLAAHPGVDKAQVQAVVDVLMEDPQFGTGRLASATEVARRLVKAGARIEAKS